MQTCCRSQCVFFSAERRIIYAGGGGGCAPLDACGFTTIEGAVATESAVPVVAWHNFYK